MINIPENFLLRQLTFVQENFAQCSLHTHHTQQNSRISRENKSRIRTVKLKKKSRTQNKITSQSNLVEKQV